MQHALVAALVAAVALAGCVQDGHDDDRPQVLFETTLGDFVVELWPDVAPVTVENFLQYVDDGFYDGLTFHRIAPGFVVQGGGFEPDHQTLRETRDPIVNEASTEVPNEQWTLSMARTSEPDSATSQFFINLADNEALDKNAQSAGYAVFGKVISGRDTVEAMTQVQPGRSFGQAGGFYPAEPIVIEEASRTSGHGEEAEAEAPERFDCPVGPRPAGDDVVADLITAGTFCITNSEDHVMVWAQNRGGVAASVEWAVTGADGGPLPDGWNATFDQPTASLTAAGGEQEAIHTMLHITVPDDADGEHALELHSGNSVTAITAHVDLRHDRLAEEGDQVNVAYAGRCAVDDRDFDSGEFPLALGGGRAIVGFDRGLIGMGWNENAEIYLPAPLAYGNDSGPCAGDEADLIFDVTIIDL